MALRGEKQITKALNKWLEKNNFECRVAGLDTDFYWLERTDSIWYSVFSEEETEILWAKLLKELGAEFTIDTFYSSFLHEVQHSETYHTLLEEEIEESLRIKQLIDEDPDSFDDIYEVYFHLPDEIIATKAMVDYINTHTEEVKELVETVSPLIMRFFRLNNIAIGE